jgi:hypothetical protein
MTLRLLIYATLAAILSLCMSLSTHNAAAMEGKTMPSEQVRESVIAGSWYPGNASRLRREVQDYLSQASTVDLEGQLIALISPHAGYRYSGQVAAYAYKLLGERKFSSVVVIAPKTERKPHRVCP